MSDLSDLNVLLSMAISECDAVIYAYGWMPDPERDAVLDDAKGALREARAAWDAELVKIERELGVEDYCAENASWYDGALGTLGDEHLCWEQVREEWHRVAGFDREDWIAAIRDWRIAGARLIAALEGAG